MAALVVWVAGCGGGAGSGDRPTGSALAELPSGWSELPAPPEVRSRGAIAWTGEELLVWGGYMFSGSGEDVDQSDGFAFAADDREWRSMAAAPLAPRVHPASAWTGDELLIWGGIDGRQELFFGDGAAYDPKVDRWRRLPDAPIGARAPLSVWTGDELLVWGTAVRVHPRPRDGAAYDPTTNAWRPIADAPIELTDATAVWTGLEMVVFGAALHGGNFPETATAIAAAYEPETDTWRELLDSSLSPQASTAAWTGEELIAWDYLNGTAALDPVRTSGGNSPMFRSIRASAVQRASHSAAGYSATTAASSRATTRRPTVGPSSPARTTVRGASSSSPRSPSCCSWPEATKPAPSGCSRTARGRRPR